MKACLIVGAGGAIGSMLRYLMSLISLDESVMSTAGLPGIIVISVLPFSGAVIEYSMAKKHKVA